MTVKAISILRLFLLATLTLTFSMSVQAADLVRIQQLFNQHFWGSFYQPNRCGLNVQEFIRLSIKERIDLKETYLIELTNKGPQNFGLVGALYARERGPLLGTNSYPNKATRFPGEANWEFHAFLVADGYVFDFDFGNDPQPIAFGEYFRRMLVPQPYQNDRRSTKNVLNGYYIKFYPINPIAPENAFTERSLLSDPRGTDLVPYLENLGLL